MNSYKRVALLGSLLALTLVSVACGSATPNTSVALESLEEEAIPMVALDLEAIARSADPADILVVTPANLDPNNDFFVAVGSFTPATHFNISDLVTLDQLLEGWPNTADSRLTIGYNRNQNQTIITIRANGNRVRIRLRGADFRGQITFDNFIFDEPTIPSVDPCVTATIVTSSASIQTAISTAPEGTTICVEPGTYNENLKITQSKLTLLSTQGRDSTIIQGSQPPSSGGSNLGTIVITTGSDGIQIGDQMGSQNFGFKVVGIDGPSSGIEAAAIYFQGDHADAKIIGNEIKAEGDAGLITEFSATITGFLIDKNILSGQTFAGTKPNCIGFSNQFTEPNVPRQLVVIGGGANGTKTTNITFSNNQVTGTAGGTSQGPCGSETGTAGDPQGNNLVTIDAAGSVITNNIFAGTTSRFATQLRTRRPNITIQNNTFQDVGLLVPSAGHLFLQNASTSTITFNAFERSADGLYIGQGADPAVPADLLSENTFAPAADLLINAVVTKGFVP
ncbi:MAG: hypothetical protein HC924_12095 [Synechococcaceae cyanobacterium SM2_3_2]|nr:hypothetical protein [Synechococcaceae cyanobacterium SM2_3_2]